MENRERERERDHIHIRKMLHYSKTPYTWKHW